MDLCGPFACLAVVLSPQYTGLCSTCCPVYVLHCSAHICVYGLKCGQDFVSEKNMDMIFVEGPSEFAMYGRTMQLRLFFSFLPVVVLLIGLTGSCS